MDLHRNLEELLARHNGVALNPTRRDMIRLALERREAVAAKCGALAVWTRPESTGRAPQDTVTVRHPGSGAKIDWDAPNNLPITPETFDMLVADALARMEKKCALFVTDRVVGADPAYCLPIRVVADRALTALFTDNMFRRTPPGAERSVFSARGFTILVLPHDKLDRARYEGRLRKLPDGRTTDMTVAMDFDRRLGVVIGSAYCGSVKKMVFTVMNYLLPDEGILPLHCSANEGSGGDLALFLGLSGTGKTTLSADPDRALLGDDEHGWCDRGIANFENGCYAKLVNLNPAKEPEIHRAVFHEAHPLEHGAIVENTMMYPDGSFDLDDERLTPNSRASYLLSELSNIKPSSTGGHPKTIVFLTADANGVLPPVSRLGADEAMLWFMMGYTSKLAGTETGVTEPKSTFSRFFGGPFMPRNPDDYARLLGDKMKRHGATVWLVNTGWSGGPHGVGKRMDITLTRRMITAALTGGLAGVAYRRDNLFHLDVPTACPGVPDGVLNPRDTWKSGEAYDERAKKLAAEFAAAFEKSYGKKNIPEAVRKVCPGR